MKRVLVKVGGATLLDPSVLKRLVEDIQAAHADGAQLLVVHGGGPQATMLARRLGFEPQFRGGRRVTDADMLLIAQQALVGEAGTTLLAACRGAGIPAVSLSASSGGLVRAVRRPPRQVAGVEEPVDFGFVADVAEVDGALLDCLWSGGFVPVLSSIVISDEGQPLNLNADTLVAALGKRLSFDEVVFVADVPGVFVDLDDPSSHIPHLTPDEVKELIAAGVVQGGMVAKLTEMCGLLNAGVGSVWLVGIHEPRPLISLLRDEPGRRTRLTLG